MESCGTQCLAITELEASDCEVMPAHEDQLRMTDHVARVLVTSDRGTPLEEGIGTEEKNGTDGSC